eukprot:TRINITY_DN715_c0_g2_i2.p1 TRINITY_DN715_c0_g2~~TRINITY_DN715_c0_g2_i2.p1  ORF type:complete len:276 (+),score=51.90 TRINITY_DN715_c0_g2_i2:100-828(+)
MGEFPFEMSHQDNFECTFPCCCCEMDALTAAKAILLYDSVTLILETAYLLVQGNLELLLTGSYLAIVIAAFYFVHHQKPHFTRTLSVIVRYIACILKTILGILILFVSIALFVAASRIDDRHEYRRDEYRETLGAAIVLLFYSFYLIISGGLNIFVSAIYQRTMKILDEEHSEDENPDAGTEMNQVPNQAEGARAPFLAGYPQGQQPPQGGYYPQFQPLPPPPPQHYGVPMNYPMNPSGPRP